VLVVRHHVMLMRVVLKGPVRDGAIHQARTGEPCCFAIGAPRLALLQPKADVASFLLTLVLTVLLKDEVTRPTKISGQGFSVFCVPHPEPRQLLAGGGRHLRR
jgi:hypothetical protein